MYGLLFLLANEKSNLGQVAAAAVKRTFQLVLLFLFRGNTSQHLQPIHRREIVFWKSVDEKSLNQSKNYVESLDKLLRKKNRVLKENSIVLCIYLFNRLHVSTSFSFWHSFWVTKWSEPSLQLDFLVPDKVFRFFCSRNARGIYGRFHGLKLPISTKTKCDPFILQISSHQENRIS